MKDIIRMNQLAGIITEGQARKMMEILTEGEVDEMATLINKKPSGNEKSLQVGDIIKWQQAVSSGDNYLGKNYVTMKGKVTKILGPSNVEAEDLETGDLYKVSRKELTVVSEMATLINKKSSEGSGKPVQVGDTIKWQQAVSSGDNYYGKNYVTMKGKVTRLLGSANVEAEDLETGDLYRVSRKELTVIS